MKPIVSFFRVGLAAVLVACGVLAPAMACAPPPPTMMSHCSDGGAETSHMAGSSNVSCMSACLLPITAPVSVVMGWSLPVAFAVPDDEGPGILTVPDVPPPRILLL